MAARATPSGHPRSAEASLDDRSRRVLAAIVRDYIHGGEPVGSHAIARRPDVDVSSATVRSVMSDLEEMGFLQKPHTSAGRIPTALGFRYYVDALLRVKPPLPEEREQIARRAQEATQLDGLMTAASRVLHSLTHHAGVIASPRPQSERLQLAVPDRTLAAAGLRIFIGAESGIVEPDLAIVAAPYRLKGEVVGALGVIGPTRMDYSRVVPLVELTARTVGLTLDAKEEA